MVMAFPVAPSTILITEEGAAAKGVAAVDFSMVDGAAAADTGGGAGEGLLMC